MDQATWNNLEEVFPKVDDYEQHTVSDLFDVADLINDTLQRIHGLAEETGMPSLHFYLLEHLALKGGAAPLGELLTALNVPKQSATYIVDRLEKDKLVMRRTNTNDRRRYEVVLTPKGRRRVKAKLGPFYDALLSAMQCVPQRDRVVLRRALKQFRTALEAPAAAALESA